MPNADQQSTTSAGASFPASPTGADAGTGQATPAETTRRGLWWALAIGACLALAPGFYTAWAVTTRGCNPFLDQSAHGAPLCR